MNTFSRTLTIVRKLAPRVLKYRDIRNRIIEGKEVSETELEREARLFTDALISLGPTFIKFGQVLSVRADVLPDSYLRELQRLQDEVPPAPFEEVKTYAEEAGVELTDKVIAAASLGQVHIGYFQGQIVAVKVNRPRVEEILRTDIKIMKRLLPFLRLIFDSSFVESIKIVVDLFSKRIFDELDYTKEAFYHDKIQEELKDFNVKIPKIVKATKKVLIMEYLPGYKITSDEALRNNDRRALAWRVFKVFMVPLFEEKYFHADPHPGNISVDENGSLILYDFGMVGSIDPETRIKLVRLYLSLSRGDAIMVVNVLDQLGAIQPFANRDVLVKGFDLMIRQAKGEVEQIELEDFNRLASQAFYKFPLRLPEKLALYLRMSGVLEGTCKMIDPDFDFVQNTVRLMQEERLARLALIDELSDYFRTANNAIKASMLRKGEPSRKRSKKWIGSLIIAISLPLYFFTNDAYLAILVSILGLSITLSLP
ncbi:AarF/ABC1/UbiB kinase family protein [Acidianus sp. RZ1]|uniref:ABC1 kinase family protein n=1 Tax=Acidianus sp. RZ1 TaxID=1540082 RepID=UPI001492E18D|nr:AarF/UbiB family protein [Acidianus sp. RZ1]NON63072.1 AarF/ABC1/UbiB kinase family protein [Acidianus sp. RZ1]